MSLDADVLIMNAHVFTCDGSKPRAEAVAIKANRIVFVGSSSEAKDWHRPGTRIIDAGGNSVLPGFIDAHFHLLWGCNWLGSAQLQQAGNLEGLTRTLRDFSEENRDSQWVDGRGIKYGIVATRQELDAICADRPVFVGAYDGHTAWANTTALELAGILHGGQPVGPNGIIVRDANGLATGELRESDAMSIVHDLIPEPSGVRKRELLIQGMKQITASGVTSVHNMNGDMEEMMTYAALEEAGEMRLRVYVPCWVKPDTPRGDLSEAAAMSEIQGEYVRGGAVKFFMDGVWESYTALNLEPYADDLDATGSGIWSLEDFIGTAGACDALGLQIFVHACGDGAVRRTLAGYQAIRDINGRRDSRHRVEHIEVIHPEDMPRFRQLDVIASMQPMHVPMSAHDADVWLDRTGPQRWPVSFAWRALKDAGARLVFGSDWTVAPYNPMLGLSAALNRQKWEPGNPDQRLTLEELLIGYTRDAAYGEFQEGQKGQIKAGHLADIVLLAEDIFQTNPEEIAGVAPLITMVDGKTVYEA